MKRASALGWAIALHAVLLYGLSRVSWSVREPEPASRSVIVWLHDWPPQTPSEQARSVHAKARQDKAAVAASQPKGGRETSHSTRPGRLRAEQKAGPAAPPPGPRAASRGSRRGETRLDLEQLRHEAVASVSKQRERERRYMTFSLRDLPDRKAGSALPGPKVPKTNVFSSGRAHESRHLLAFDKPARTKLGRWLRDTCHALTDGGLGVGIFGFGLGDICVESNARGDLFGDIKPDYLKSGFEASTARAADTPR